MRDKLSGSRPQDLSDPHLLRAEYLELGGLTGDEGVDYKPAGPVTNIEGGVRPLEWEIEHSANNEDLGRDGTYVGKGIKKTIHIESYPQPAPPTVQGTSHQEKS